MILNTITSRDLLIDAYKFYTRGDARAHDALKIIVIRNDMAAAVLSCLDEAIKEEELDKQNLYVQAAHFGKKFHPGIAIEEFQSVCRTLRVMNIARSLNLDNVKDMKSVIDQLVEEKKFDLALWVARWLKEDGEARIITKWSDYLIENRRLTDEQIASKILQVLGKNPIVSYADIANKAIENKRIILAIKLIEQENESMKQIPLLLSLKRYDLVLAQALATCDSNLIYTAIFKLKESMPDESKFLELLKKQELAFKYYCNFLTIVDVPKLIKITHSEGLKDELDLYLLENAHLDHATRVAKSLKQEFVCHQIELRLKLSKFQQSLKNLKLPARASKSTWVGLPVSETIINLIILGQNSKAKDCQKRFEVSDKKYRILEQIALNILPPLTISPIQT